MQKTVLSNDSKQGSVIQNEILPFDLGAKAYQDRKMPEENPYPYSDWRNQEWWKGWNFAEEGDPRQLFDHVFHKFKD